MRFRRRARLDPGQVSDRRGRTGGFGGAGFNPRILTGGGGGIIGLVVLALYLFGSFSGGGGSNFGLQGEENKDLAKNCETGTDANQSQDCRIVAIVNSVQDYWGSNEGLGNQYEVVDTVLFTDQVNTGCGNATSAVGPFYCPVDKHVYIDLGFFDELHSQFGAEGGPFAEAYVLAHEYGHHVQNLLGTNDKVGNETGPKSGSVRLELQADCFAGVWAANAVDTGLITKITNDDIKIGLDAAASVGDDRIQEKAQGRVDPESFTHGTAEQRQQWFTTGYRNGTREACNTFAPNAL